MVAFNFGQSDWFAKMCLEIVSRPDIAARNNIMRDSEGVKQYDYVVRFMTVQECFTTESTCLKVTGMGTYVCVCVVLL